MIHPSKWAAFAAVLCCCFSTLIAQPQEIPIAGSLEGLAMQVVSSESSPISESDITAAQQFGHSTTVPEWLGSIAPVAAVLPHNAVGSRVGNGFVTAAVFFDRRISDSSGWWPQVSSVLHFGTYVFRLGAAALAMASIRRHRFDRR